MKDDPSAELGIAPVRLYNKLEDSYHLHNKKALLYNMKTYYELLRQDPYDALPVTFHIKQGPTDPEFE
jgi:tubulin--tyrosine ligase